MRTFKRREWTEEELQRYLNTYMKKKRERERQWPNPLAPLEWLVVHSLLALERAVRRLVKLIFR